MWTKNVITCRLVLGVSVINIPYAKGSQIDNISSFFMLKHIHLT